MATQNDDPLADLAKARDKIEHTRDVVLPGLRTRRDQLICIAREHGAIGDELAHAAGISRQAVHEVLRAHNIPAPARTRSTESRARFARIKLVGALDLAEIDPDTDAQTLGDAIHRALRNED
jgi:hypothetical protein